MILGAEPQPSGNWRRFCFGSRPRLAQASEKRLPVSRESNAICAESRNRCTSSAFLKFESYLSPHRARAPRLRGSALRAARDGLRAARPKGCGDRCSVAPDCLFSRINSCSLEKTSCSRSLSLIPLAAMRAVRPDDDAVALACGSGGAHRRNRALAGTEERASAKFSAASSCGLSNILVQIENRTPDRPNFEPRRYNPCTVSIARRGRREFSPLATARALKRLKTAMGGSCKSSGSAPHPLGVGAA